jgi:hypothetical protein
MTERQSNTVNNDWVDTTAGGEGGGGTAVGTEELGGPITDPRVGEAPETEASASLARSDLGGPRPREEAGPGADLGEARGSSPGPAPRGV